MNTFRTTRLNNSCNDSQLATRFTQHRDALLRLAISFTHNREDAEDLVQDTLLRACQRTGTFQAERTDLILHAWLRIILRRLFFNQYRDPRREWRKQQMPWDATTDGWLTGEKSNSVQHSPEQTLLLQYSVRATLAALALLDQEQRDVLELAVFDELSYDEIAQRLEIPVGTVRSRLHRARERVARAVVVWLQ